MDSELNTKIREFLKRIYEDCYCLTLGVELEAILLYGLMDGELVSIDNVNVPKCFLEFLSNNIKSRRINLSRCNNELTIMMNPPVIHDNSIEERIKIIFMFNYCEFDDVKANEMTRKILEYVINMIKEG